MAANTIRDIVDYTLKFKEQPLNEDAVKQAKKLVLDTLGVSISGWKEPSIAKIYRAIDRGDSTWTAQAFGTGERLPLEWAIICNGALARVQDYMDVYYDLDASHPAEYIPFVFCCCDALGLSGEQAIRGILLAYDLQLSLIHI